MERVCGYSFVFLAALPCATQESATLFDAPLVVTSPTQRLDHLLDWNGDGVQDFVTYYEGSFTVGMIAHRNDGEGRLVGLFSLGRGGGGGGSHMETIDANGDAREDLAWVGARNGGFYGFMHVLAMPGNQVERVRHLEFEGSSSAPIDFGTVLDADLDGDADRVRIAGQTLILEIFEETAPGTWIATTSTLELGFNTQALVRMDFDGDAYPDLYLHRGVRGSFVPLAGGSLHAPVTLQHGVASDMPMAIPGDVDGDGDQDLAIFNMNGYKLYRRTGPASWTLEPFRAGGPAAKFADVDGDGDLDGVCCGGGGSTPKYFDNASTFRVALNDGGGDFAPAFSIPGLGSREIAGAADLDQDGDVDLAGGQCIYFARGPLKGPPQRTLAAPQSQRGLADFDRDGDVDFGPGLGGFARHLGNGVGRAFTLLCPAPPPGTSDEGPGLPGDWDGDGDVDLLVRRWLGPDFQEMRLLTNEGGGSYADCGTASTSDFLPGITGVEPERSFAEDLDLDGDLDLVTYLRSSYTYGSWTKGWVNDGAGHFTLAWQAASVWPIGFAQLHGSSAPDALLVRYSDATVYLHPGLGDGTFEANGLLGLYMGGTLGAASLVMEDLDQDGDVDLAGAFQFGGAGWYHGKGWFIPNVGGTLSLADKVLLDDLDSQISASDPHPTPRIAHASDVDGDGLKDVILSSPLHRRAAISIVRRASDNSGWLSPVHQVVYPLDPADEMNVAAVAGAMLDIDGDGDDDYVSDAIWSNPRRGPHLWGARRQDTSGTGDAAGRVPTLGASGPFRPGGTMSLRLTGVPAGVPATLLAAGTMPGSKLRTMPERFLPVRSFVTSGPALPGAGEWTLTFAVPFSTLVHRLRVELVDPADPTRLLRSNELELTFGQ
ncbi:MAG TPA: VCBS repeat-containing protein [Planctomycetota bacterium]